MADIFDQMAANWDSEIVARSAVPLFTGGLLGAKSLANLDCAGRGPTRIRIGRKIGYPKKDFAAWLRARAEK